MDFDILKQKIEELNNNKQRIKVFKILHNNEDQYVINDTGLYIPISKLKNKTLNELKYFLQSTNKIKNKVIKPNEALENLKKSKKSSLSHQEKILLKKIDLNNDLL